ncbi:MAG: class I SAM-dependent methyltransferase [Verrucomicrobiota bacterium]
MTDFKTMTNGLSQSPEGIWHKQGRERGNVSYPTDGNENVFQVEDHSFWFRHRNQVIENLVNEYSPGELIFDIGGGNGCVTKWLQDKGIEAVLLEPGSDGVRNAANRGVEQIIHSTFEESDFDDGAIPAAGMFDVLEHIEKDKEALSMLYQKIQPGGRLFLTVPAFGALWSVEDDHAGHFRRYSLGQLREILEQSGFEVEYASYLFSFLIIPIWIFRSLPSHLGFRRNVKLETARKEHSSGRGFINKLVNRLLKWELKKIRRKETILLGSSCLVVAKKVCSIESKFKSDSDIN